MVFNVRFLTGALLPGLLVLALSGCDIAADVRLGGTPVNSGGTGDELDPADDENVVAYFYTDKPVEGLYFSCNLVGRTPITGYTDQDGRFVCPRASTVSFFVGVPAVDTVKLGEMSLGIFGSASTADARSEVTITPASISLPYPATPFGTTATDGDIPQVANLFNLLRALDTSISRTGRHQPTIVLTGATHAALAKTEQFANVDLSLPTNLFASGLQVLMDELIALPESGMTLVNSTALSGPAARHSPTVPSSVPVSVSTAPAPSCMPPTSQTTRAC